MHRNLFNAHIELRKIFGVLPRTPWTPIQAFGLGFNEYLVQRPIPATDKDADNAQRNL